ncbi:MAG TPA: hypothetical protein VLM89_11325 [Phycisphaerae bacterium]|nr:hypothetical protein [Phycisphaerae bacterium]
MTNPMPQSALDSSTAGAMPDLFRGPRPPHGRTAWFAGLLILAGMVNNAPSLRWGFMYDDFMHQAVLRGLDHGARPSTWNLYDFFDTADALTTERGVLGVQIWWADPDSKIRFLRPVTSLSIRLDHALYGRWAMGYHMTSLALFAVLLLLAHKLYQALGAPSRASLWALAFLALEDNHFLSAGWIAHRNSLLASLFTLATVLAVHRYCRGGRKVRHLVVGGLFFLLACGSKESGIISAALVGLYLLMFDRGPAPEPLTTRCLRLARSPALWLFAIMAVAYLAAYVAAGFGACSMTYPTPWGSPAEFARRTLISLPLAMMSIFFGVSADLFTLYPGWTLPALCLGVPLLIVAGFILFRAVRWSPWVGFACGYAALPLLVSGGTEPSDRVLLDTSVGTSLLIGLFLDRLGPLRRLPAVRPYTRLVLGAVLILVGLVNSVPLTLVKGEAVRDLARLDESIVRTAPVTTPASGPAKVVLLNSPSSLLSLMFGPMRMVLGAPDRIQAFPMQLGRRPLSWRRDGDRTMTLTSLAEPLLASRFEDLFRSPHARLAPGRTYRTSDFKAVIMAIEDGGVRTVRIEFDRSLDDPGYQFLAWQGDRLVRVSPPPIGQAVELPAAPKLRPFAP